MLPGHCWCPGIRQRGYIWIAVRTFAPQLHLWIRCIVHIPACHRNQWRCCPVSLYDTRDVSSVSAWCNFDVLGIFVLSRHLLNIRCYQGIYVQGHTAWHFLQRILSRRLHWVLVLYLRVSCLLWWAWLICGNHPAWWLCIWNWVRRF